MAVMGIVVGVVVKWKTIIVIIALVDDEKKRSKQSVPSMILMRSRVCESFGSCVVVKM